MAADGQRLLSTRQMAGFAADGFVRLDAVVPGELCDRICAEFDDGILTNLWPDYAGQPPHLRPGQPLANFFGETAYGQALQLPAVAGTIASLVGPDPIYDHHYFHVTRPGSGAQPLHYDAIIDFRLDFDVQLFLFLQDTPLEMGGTLVVPGSHLRPTPDLSRMHNVVGQLPTVCPAGTLVACHHGIWHGARPNRADRDRYVVKLRLNPRVVQTRLWEPDDGDDPTLDEDVKAILTKAHGWEGAGYRHEVVRRIRLWRLLSGDDTYDTESWLRRLDRAPSARPL
jgi:hypothetical protein